MTNHRLLLPTTIAFTALLYARPSVAQTDAMHLAYVSTANQVGVMEYCMSKGWADQTAVDAQKKAVASLPPNTDRTGLTEAEATGRSGELMNNGTTISLASMAQRGNTTEQDLCTKMVSAAKMVAAQRSLNAGHARHAKWRRDAQPSPWHGGAVDAGDAENTVGLLVTSISTSPVI